MNETVKLDHRHTTNVVTPKVSQSVSKPDKKTRMKEGEGFVPVLSADDLGRTSPCRLDVLATPGLNEVVMMLTTQLFLRQQVSNRVPANLFPFLEAGNRIG